MEEICIRGKVGTQNQELNSKVKVSRVCGLKFVLDVEGGKKAFGCLLLLFSILLSPAPLL